MNDIKDIEDIKLFVDEFYAKIRQDDLLAPIFALRIEGGNWDRHLNRMYIFWNTVLLYQKGYKGNPFAKHVGLPVSEKHFSRWVDLFCQTIDAHFSGSKAEETKKRASRMATMFMHKMAYLDKNPGFKSIM